MISDRNTTQIIQSARDLVTDTGLTPRETGLLNQVAGALVEMNALSDALTLFSRALELQPKNRTAKLGRVDCLTGLDRLDAAMACLDDLYSSSPRSHDVLHRKARLLVHLGQIDAAADTLKKTPMFGADSVKDWVASIKLLVEVEALDEVESLGTRLKEIHPKSRGIWDALTRVPLLRADGHGALERCAQAEAALGDVSLVLFRRVSAYVLLGAVDPLLKMKATHLDSGSNEIQGFAFRLGQALATLGRHADAADCFRSALHDNKEDVKAWSQMINAILASEGMDAALMACSDGIRDCPGVDQLVLKKADLLGQADRADEAIRLVNKRVKHPQGSADALRLLTNLHLRAGDHEAAIECVKARLSNGLIGGDDLISVSQVLSNWGRGEVVLTLLDSLEQIAIDFCALSNQPDLVLCHASIAYKCSQKARARELILRLKDHIGSLAAADRTDLIVLAEKLGQYDVVSEIVKDIGKEGPVDRNLAILVIRKAMASGDAGFAAVLQDQLVSRMPAKEAHNFDLEFAILRYGCVQAADRSLRPAPVNACGRSSDEARGLAHFLQHAGRARLSLRYMRFCARRWPNARWLPTLMAMAHMAAGAPDEALRGLDEAPIDPARDFDRARLSVIFRMGDYCGACKLLDQRRAAGRALEEDEQIIIAHLMHGELPRAKAAIASNLYGLLKTQRAEAHFKSSFLGKLLNEAEIKSINVKATEVDTSETLATFASAAVISISACRELQVSSRTPTDIPKNIFQFWDSEIIPDYLHPILESWNSLDGWSHKLFSRQDARLWIAKHMDREHLRAFSLLKTSAEQSDFFRLCILQIEGGIYADMDDLRIGCLDDFCALGRDLLLFQEPVGTAANNLICATPAHMVIQRAIDMCVQAVLQYDNDIAWSKTGPGLLTRALAWCLKKDPERIIQTTTLLPAYRMFPYVQPARRMPYKDSVSHWNTRQVDLNPQVMSVLRDIVAVSGIGSQ